MKPAIHSQNISKQDFIMVYRETGRLVFKGDKYKEGKIVGGFAPTSYPDSKGLIMVETNGIVQPHSASGEVCWTDLAEFLKRSKLFKRS